MPADEEVSVVAPTAESATPDFILRTQGLGRDFLGFTAVDAVSLDVRRGEIHALIGPNGAGKTTFFNLLTQFIAPSRGRIVFNGRDITSLAPAQVARLGIVRSFQVSAVFPSLSVLQNVRVALQRKQGASLQFWRSSSRLAALDEQAHELLSRVRLHAHADRPAGEIAYGQKRALELATTLALDPELVLLDEPTQGMGHEDVDHVIELVREVGKARTVIMVEHNMKVVASISDRITVLTRGAVLAEGSYAEMSGDARVIEAYMGRPRRRYGQASTEARAA
ncbi:MAG: transporter ATP-binding protein [Rhizobacter sp.]|nr:transporter ATP-binding protein [Rhizobacter sp.]